MSYQLWRLSNGTQLAKKPQLNTFLAIHARNWSTKASDPIGFRCFINYGGSTQAANWQRNATCNFLEVHARRMHWNVKSQRPLSVCDVLSTVEGPCWQPAGKETAIGDSLGDPCPQSALEHEEQATPIGLRCFIHFGTPPSAANWQGNHKLQTVCISMPKEYVRA